MRPDRLRRESSVMRATSFFCSLIVVLLLAYALGIGHGTLFNFYGKPKSVNVLSGGYAFVDLR